MGMVLLKLETQNSEGELKREVERLKPLRATTSIMMDQLRHLKTINHPNSCTSLHPRSICINHGD